MQGEKQRRHAAEILKRRQSRDRQGRYTGQTSQRYAVAEWPTLIVIDQQGRVVGPVAKKKLAETLSRLLEKEAGK